MEVRKGGDKEEGERKGGRKVGERVERDLGGTQAMPPSRYLLLWDFSLFSRVTELDLPGCQINSLRQ